MIGTLLRLSWLNLRRDYLALSLTLVLPIVFFSIFALIFAGVGERGGEAAVTEVAIVDRDQSELSGRFIDAIGQLGAATDRLSPASHTRDGIRDLVRTGEHPVVVVIPAGFGDTYARLRVAPRPVEIIYDAADPVTRNVVAGLLDAAALRAAPDVLLENWLDELGEMGGALNPQQREALDALRPYLRGDKPWPGAPRSPDGASNGGPEGLGSDDAVASGVAGLIQVQASPARAESGNRSIVAYYAAGIGVMFLLFSMTAAGGSLLDEEERGTLERVLMSNVPMTRLLVAKWIFYSLLGVVQVTLMFLWAALVFDLELFTLARLIGFSAMTLMTGIAAASFGILLATACRTRAQLTGLSIIIILIMSALGGSMVPRFAMPDFMHMTSLFTFNGWALDGYLKVFWYDDPAASPGRGLLDILPQLAVLGVMAAGFFTLARIMARRWETQA